MSKKQLTALRLDGALLDAMRVVKRRDGVPLTTQIELALRDWLNWKHGIQVERLADPAKERDES